MRYTNPTGLRVSAAGAELVRLTWKNPDLMLASTGGATGPCGVAVEWTL